jgi:hypothetical protein
MARVTITLTDDANDPDVIKVEGDFGEEGVPEDYNDATAAQVQGMFILTLIQGVAEDVTAPTGEQIKGATPVPFTEPEE